MRLIKMFSLAAIAAVAAMAFLGASSASAGSTLLCSNAGAALDGTGCTAAKKIHFVTSGHALLLGTITVECQGLLSAETHDLLVTGGPVVFDLNVLLHYTGCLGGCKATVIDQGEVTVLKTGVELGTIEASGFLVKVTCFGLDCDYDATGLKGHGVLSGGTAHTSYVKQTVNNTAKLGGFITCPASGALDALYVALGSEPLFIRA